LNSSAAKEPCASLTAMKGFGWAGQAAVPGVVSPVLPAPHHFFLTDNGHISAPEKLGMYLLPFPLMYLKHGS